MTDLKLQGTKILLGISGSIAAYKSAFLTRLMIKAGAEVQIVMTPSAKSFITPLTLSTLSKHPVHSDVSNEDSWNNHVELGLWADLMIVAPCTASTLGKLANGICDNMLIASYLSAKCPVYIAPAMDLDMWKHPSTVSNIEKLVSYGNKMIPVGHGELASGLVGDGRMAEPEEIVDFIYNNSLKNAPLKGKKAIVTAGPTYESLDPVRFIGNHSSGKMGISIAEALAKNGVAVKLILGPTHLSTKMAGIDTIRVQSAQEMYEVASQFYPDSDFGVLAAAVADYRPANFSDKKIKKKPGDMSIELERTIDIAATLGKNKRDNQLLIGFALETNNEIENATKKVEKKNFDFIVLNSLKEKGAGFKHDTNKVTFIGKTGKIRKFELKPKIEVANDIVAEIIALSK